MGRSLVRQSQTARAADLTAYLASGPWHGLSGLPWIVPNRKSLRPDELSLCPTLQKTDEILRTTALPPGGSGA